MSVNSDLRGMTTQDEAILFGDLKPISLDDPEEYAAAVAGIQRALDDFAAGRHQPLGGCLCRYEGAVWNPKLRFRMRQRLNERPLLLP